MKNIFVNEIKAVIFDMDGVLVDSMKYHIYSWKEAFEKYNLQITNEELSLFEGMSYKETIDRVSRNNNVKLSQDQKDEIYKIKNQALDKNFKFEKYEGIIEFLQKLKENHLKLAVVTGANKEFTKKIVEEHFENLFDIVITSDDV